MNPSLTPRRLTLAALAVLAVVALTVAGISRGAGSSRAGVAPSVQSALVNINTRLGYQQASAAGTGIVLTSDGEVLTNNHVIKGATTIRATVVGTGRTYAARVLGYSVANDIALLKLQNASGLETASLADSSGVKTGDSVTAIGNAGGAGGTPSSSAGSVTGLGRSITASDGDGNSEQLTGLIETDAQLQPGDSGGALVDGKGRVVGMLTAASTGYRFFYYRGSSGAGYAIPINHAVSLVKQIESKQSSSTVHVGGTPLLGVTVQQADPYGFGDSSATGAIVASVLDGSPAAKAGLSYGSVITAVDGKKVSTPTSLTKILLRKQPGAKVLVVWSDQYGTGHRATVQLAVGPPQ